MQGKQTKGCGKKQEKVKRNKMKNIDIQSFRTKLLEEQTEWPKQISSRFADEYLFIHDDKKPGVYNVTDVATKKTLYRAGFKSVEQAKKYAADLIKPQGGRQSSHFEENIDLPGNQEKIDVAEPKGKITAADFKKLRSMKKEGQYKHSIDQLLKIVQTKKAGPEYKKALMDLINLAKEKTGKEIHSIADLKQALDYEEPKIREGADHEVAMAMSSLKEIVSNASQLMDKLGGMERDIPGWIQDHITNAENYIEQANQGFHELQ